MVKRILVTGSREWDDVDTVIDALVEWVEPGDTIIEGHCPTGLDDIVYRLLVGDSRWVVESHPADWKKHGKAAGPLRNQEMVDSGADVCLAFPKGDSRGTRDCMKRAKQAGIEVVNYGE